MPLELTPTWQPCSTCASSHAPQSLPGRLPRYALPSRPAARSLAIEPCFNQAQSVTSKSDPSVNREQFRSSSAQFGERGSPAQADNIRQQGFAKFPSVLQGAIPPDG